MQRQPSALLLAAFVFASAATVGRAAYCAAELGAWDECLHDLVGGQGAQKCYDCIELSNLAITEFTRCDQITQNHCFYQNACSLSCDSRCEGLYEEYLGCFWGSDCYTGCSGERPVSTARLCADEEVAAGRCVDATGDGVDACLSCLQDLVPESDGRTCEASELYTCRANEECPECGSCETELVTMVNCYNKVLCEPFTCSDTASDPAAEPTPSPEVPTPSPIEPTPLSEEPTRSFSDDPTPSPQHDPTLSPQHDPTPSPQEEPTPPPQEDPTPSPQKDPTPSPQDEPTTPGGGGGGGDCEASEAVLQRCFTDSLSFGGAVQCSACVTKAFSDTADEGGGDPGSSGSVPAAAAAAASMRSSSSSSTTSRSSACNDQIRGIVAMRILACECGECTSPYVDHLFCVNGPTWLGACPLQENEEEEEEESDEARSSDAPSFVPTTEPPNRLRLLLVASRSASGSEITAGATGPPPSSGGRRPLRGLP
jgi:hypothetical protein